MFHPIQVSLKALFFSYPQRIECMDFYHRMRTWLDKNDPNVKLQNLTIEEMSGGRFMVWVFTNFSSKRKAMKFDKIFSEDKICKK